MEFSIVVLINISLIVLVFVPSLLFFISIMGFSFFSYCSIGLNFWLGNKTSVFSVISNLRENLTLFSSFPIFKSLFCSILFFINDILGVIDILGVLFPFIIVLDFIMDIFGVYLFKVLFSLVCFDIPEMNIVVLFFDMSLFSCSLFFVLWFIIWRLELFL